MSLRTVSSSKSAHGSYVSQLTTDSNHYSRLLVIEKALWQLFKSESHCVCMKNVSYITFLVDPLTFWIQLKLSLSTSKNHFQFFKLFCCFYCQLWKILKQLYFSMENDLRTESFKYKYDYFPIFWHLDRTLKRQVAFSAQFIFKMAANINAYVVHLIYSFI